MKYGPFLIRTINPKDAPKAIREAIRRERAEFPCPLCKVMSEDYRIALAEADNSGHRDEAELLLDYAEEVGRSLEQHIQQHLFVLRLREPRPAHPTRLQSLVEETK